MVPRDGSGTMPFASEHFGLNYNGKSQVSQMDAIRLTVNPIICVPDGASALLLCLGDRADKKIQVWKIGVEMAVERPVM